MDDVKAHNPFALSIQNRIPMLSTMLSYILIQVYRFVSFKAWWGEKMPDDVSVKDMEIALSGDILLPARIFEYQDSDESKKHPLILFFHGGGGCIGSVYTTHENCLRVFSSELKCTIVGVDYRLAPAHPAPVGADDCTAATQWIKENLKDFNSNGKVVLAGDSMGGLLSIVVPCASGASVDGAVILYPNTMYGLDEYESWKTMGGPFNALPKDFMDIMHKLLFGGKTPKDFHEGHKDESELLAKAFPLTTDEAILKKKMPPAFYVTCERDILRDEGKAFAVKLKKAGTPVEDYHYEEEHGFMCTNGRGDSFVDCLGKLKIWLGKL